MNTSFVTKLETLWLTSLGSLKEVLDFSHSMLLQDFLFENFHEGIIRKIEELKGVYSRLQINRRLKRVAKKSPTRGKNNF